MNPTSKFASVKDWVYTRYEGENISLTRAAWKHNMYGWIQNMQEKQFIKNTMK